MFKAHQRSPSFNPPSIELSENPPRRHNPARRKRKPWTVIEEEIGAKCLQHLSLVTPPKEECLVHMEAEMLQGRPRGFLPVALRVLRDPRIEQGAGAGMVGGDPLAKQWPPIMGREHDGLAPHELASSDRDPPPPIEVCHCLIEQ